MLRFFKLLLNPHERVYILSLLVPFVVYDLVLKAAVLDSIPGVALDFYLMRSNIFFDLGYVLLWIGLFAATPPGRLVRRFVVIMFHIVTMLLVIVATSSYQYFKLTGTALNYNVIALWVLDLKEVLPVLRGSVSLSILVLLLAALFYMVVGPWLLTLTIGRWREWSRRAFAGASRVSFLGSLSLWILAVGCGLISLLLNTNWNGYPSGTNANLVREPFVNVLLTGFEEALTPELNRQDDSSPVDNLPVNATAVPTPSTQKRNVVLIHLESTRAQSTTPYNSNLQTTPFLDELAQSSSLLAEEYYTTLEHTSKAIVSINCGIEPHLVERVTEAMTGGIPVPCLPKILKDQGYNTVFFQSSTENFEDFPDLVKNFGYEDYYPLETMDTASFQRVNYFGYEDSIMLKPSQQWLEDHQDKPFMAEYLLGDGHQDYGCPDSGYQSDDSTDDYMLNRYLNCIRLQDTFVQNLIQQYKDLGLYDNTVFVIYGDHGEGFGEHGLYVHDDIPYQEGLNVPLIIHAPGLLDNSQRIKASSNHTDILPTILEMLGYEVRGGEYPGYSLLGPLPEDRPFFFSCFHRNTCLASIEGKKEYIYHYGNQPDEIFDLSKDPFQQNNLADSYTQDELDKRRDKLLSWQAKVNAGYASTSE